MAKSSKKARARAKARTERRFDPRPSASPLLVTLLGGGGAAALGAGVFAQFGHAWMESDQPPYTFAPALLASGAIAFGAAVWAGTSGEAAVRVGSGGVAVEMGDELVRVPWYAVTRVVWDPDAETLAVQGDDDAGRPQRLVLTPKVHPGAIAWIVKEARERIPSVVDVPDEARGLPETRGLAGGEVLTMDAVQVVGRRCAASDRIIAYEPDARVCPRCERAFHHASLPETCPCGASFLAIASPTASAAAPESPAKDEPEHKPETSSEA